MRVSTPAFAAKALERGLTKLVVMRQKGVRKKNVMINCRQRNKKKIHSLFQLQLLSQLWSRLYMTTPSLTSCQLTHTKAMWGNWHQSGLSFLMPKP